jgi:hypothetical protein
MDGVSAAVLVLCLSAMCLAALWLLRVEPRALPPVLATAAFVFLLGALAAGLISL